MPFPYVRLIVGTRHCRILISGNINSDATGIDLNCGCAIGHIAYSRFMKCRVQTIAGVVHKFGICYHISLNYQARERLADRTRIGKLPEILFRPWHKPDRLRKRLKYKSLDRLKF